MSSLAEQLFGTEAIANVKITERGVPLPLGTHIVEIKKMFEKDTRKKGPAFIAEFVVHETDSTETKVGAEHSWYQGMAGDQGTVGIQEIFKLCFAAENIDRKGLSVAEQKACMAEFAGKLRKNDDGKIYTGKFVKIRMTSREGKGDKADRTYSNPDFYPVGG